MSRTIFLYVKVITDAFLFNNQQTISLLYFIPEVLYYNNALIAFVLININLTSFMILGLKW